jgi:carbonic anhydrase/acetyltransferase-like protein (isoleucine patch superfamily)
VKNKDKIPDKVIAVGLPTKVEAEITSDYKKQWTEYKNIYVNLVRKRFTFSLKEIILLERKK